ncbi:carbohydrate-binding module family 13 protein [Postia placenta MAD-698-R-SB12]|uniref:Carbohydrate-binding module family 13 protein n=1 Tax=Postia placenta MAD-698-R-SB12 TaxID=670580 RepID=A0A1X6NHQ1_9APHY|nr:carbohydrate-binding module family 13 protein [Postia placenta MAD-698-R-SB12]OSX68072.1 carbohydrate-binding module family 13 protein [Postia placenta MAD-698-R-SB12]
MTIKPGNYRIQNVGTGTYVDLAGGSSAQDTKVQGYTNAENLNQLVRHNEHRYWQFEKVGDNKWKILNAASGTYILAPVHAINQAVVGGTPPDVFTFIDSDGSYQIKLVDESLVLYLGSSEDTTPVVLQAADGGDNNQFWYLHPVQA